MGYLGTCGVQLNTYMYYIISNCVISNLCSLLLYAMVFIIRGQQIHVFVDIVGLVPIKLCLVLQTWLGGYIFSFVLSHLYLQSQGSYAMMVFQMDVLTFCFTIGIGSPSLSQLKFRQKLLDVLLQTCMFLLNCMEVLPVF